MSAHTPGPWEIDPDTRPGMEWNNHIVDSTGNLTICFMSHSGGLSPDRDKANARLIAAAPELLEALESFIALNLRNDGATCDWHDLIAAVANAEKAVKKAKGETP